MSNKGTFTLTIEGQEMVVNYELYYATANIAHFEFNSHYKPAKRIIISETGYHSFFPAMELVNSYASPEDFASALVKAIMNEKPIEDYVHEEEQMKLFLRFCR